MLFHDKMTFPWHSWDGIGMNWQGSEKTVRYLIHWSKSSPMAPLWGSKPIFIYTSCKMWPMKMMWSHMLIQWIGLGTLFSVNMHGNAVCQWTWGQFFFTLFLMGSLMWGPTSPRVAGQLTIEEVHISCYVKLSGVMVQWITIYIYHSWQMIQYVSKWQTKCSRKAGHVS